MSTERSQILQSALRVNPDEIRWHFTADYYDGPISGLAIFQGRVCGVCCFPEDIPDQHVYVLHELTADELQEELAIKEKFEAMVGTHWSYDQNGNPLPKARREPELTKRYYEEQKARPPRHIKPWDRPVVAWFDVNEDRESSSD